MIVTYRLKYEFSPIHDVFKIPIYKIQKLKKSIVKLLSDIGYTMLNNSSIDYN